jgi:hypothetical protein
LAAPVQTRTHLHRITTSACVVVPVCLGFILNVLFSSSCSQRLCTTRCQRDSHDCEWNEGSLHASASGLACSAFQPFRSNMRSRCVHGMLPPDTGSCRMSRSYSCGCIVFVLLGIFMCLLALSCLLIACSLFAGVCWHADGLALRAGG